MNWAWNSKVILFFKKNSELTSSSRLPSFTETSLVALFFRWMVNWGRKQENQRSPGDSWIFFWRAWRLGGKNTVLHWVSVYWHWSVQLDPSHGNNNFRRKKKDTLLYMLNQEMPSLGCILIDFILFSAASIIVVHNISFLCVFLSGKCKVERWQGSLIWHQSADLQGYEVLPCTYSGQTARVRKGAER